LVKYVEIVKIAKIDNLLETLEKDFSSKVNNYFPVVFLASLSLSWLLLDLHIVLQHLAQDQTLV